MKTSRDKVLCGLMVIMLLLSLALVGCNKESTSPSTTQDETTASKQADETKDQQQETTKKDLKGKLVVAMDQANVDDTIDPATGKEKLGWGTVFKKFEEMYPEVEIEGISVPYESHVAKTHTLLLSNSVDVITLTPYDFYVQGLIKNLKEYDDLDEVMAQYKEAFHKASRAYLSDEHIMGIPRDFEVRSCAYDKQIFEDFGVEPLSISPTPEEIFEKVPKLTGKNPRTGEQNYGFYLNGKWQSLYALDHLTNGFSFGDESVYNRMDLSKSNYNMNTDENAEKIEEFLSILKYCPPGFIADQGAENWGTEKNTVAVNIYVSSGEMQQAVNNNLTDRFIVTNGIKDSKGRIAYNDCSIWAIAENTKYPELAWEFVKFVSGDEGQRYNYVQNSYLPTLKDADFMEENPLPYAENFLQVGDAPGRHPTFVTYHIQIFRPWLNGLMAKTVDNANIDMKAELEEMQRKAEAWVKEQKPLELK